MRLEFHPAVANSGVVFVRTDLPGQPRIEAKISNRVSGPRRTSLVSHRSEVQMVEHVLSALAGMKIDNCEIRVNEAEMPGMDGSSLAFVVALQSAGKIELGDTREITWVTETIRIGDDQSWIQLSPATGQQAYQLGFQMDYPGNRAIGRQSYEAHLSVETYCTQIAPARTFVLDTEAEQLRANGLGGRVTYQDILVFDQYGPIDNQLRFEDECARHKVLDMIGDFSLIGTDIVGHFTASRSGHRLNSQVVLELLRQAQSNEAHQFTKTNRISA